MPSPGARSTPLPLSTMFSRVLPGVMVTDMLPAPLAQLMFSADSAWVPPTALGRGRRGPNTGEFAQVNDPFAFRRSSVTVLPTRAGFDSPPDRIRFLISRQSRLGSFAAISAARPATWGAAMDVPLRYA